MTLPKTFEFIKDTGRTRQLKTGRRLLELSYEFKYSNLHEKNVKRMTQKMRNPENSKIIASR